MGNRDIFFRKTFNILMILFVFSSGIYFYSFITADPDLWGHILFGKEIFSSKAIPEVDLYSYTALGMKWINHEWVSEALMWSVFNAFSSPGLLIGKTLIGLVIISLISVICFNRKVNYLSYGIVLAVSAFIMSPGFMTRPQLMTFLFSSLFFFVIHLYLEKRIKVLWALPIIMIIWVNSHGGFIIGAGILPVIAVLEYISCHIRKRDKSHISSLFIWTFLTEASMLINPYGINLLVFMYKTLSLPRSITEWAPVPIFNLSYMRFKIFSLCVFLSFLIQRNKNRHWEIGIIIVAMLFAFLHQRHTPVFAIFAAPFLAEKFLWIEKRLRLNERIFSAYSYVILSIFILFMIGYQLTVTVNKYLKTEFNIIVDPNVYPVSAVQFLKTNGINGNLLVPFDWGEYAIWKLYPENRVSIDGRFRTVYPEVVINDHFNGARSQEGWNSLLKKYPTEIVLARRNQFSQMMISEPSDDWIYIYSDNISMVFLKNSESMKEVMEKFISKKMVYPKNEISIYFP